MLVGTFAVIIFHGYYGAIGIEHMRIIINFFVVAIFVFLGSCMLPYTAYTVLPMNYPTNRSIDKKIYHIYFSDLKKKDKFTGYTKITVSFGSPLDSIIKIVLQDVKVIVRNKEYDLIGDNEKEILLEGKGNGINRRYSGYWQCEQNIELPYALSKGEILVSINYQIVTKPNIKINRHVNESFYIKKTEGQTPLISH